MGNKKKPKKYAEGGLAGIAENAKSLMGSVDDMANSINYGSTKGSSGAQPLGLQSVLGFTQPTGAKNVTPSMIQNYRTTVKDMPQGFKKGGLVSASKRADGIAIKGKTKGRMV